MRRFDVLFIVMLAELFAGGGGRLLAVGPVTVRMVLFGTALLATFFLYHKRPDLRRCTSLACLLVVGFFCVHLAPLCIGVAKGASATDIFNDASPLLFWLIAPFFALVLHNQKMVYRTATLVQWTACMLALVYLCVFAALTNGWVNVESFHHWAESTGEIAFRNDTMFFYKGFLYLGIGVVFLTALGGRWHGFWLVAVVVALTLTLTRGFVLATSLATALMLLTMGRKRSLLVALGVSALVIYAVWAVLPSIDQGGMLEQRAISDSIRMKDLKFIRDNFNAYALLFGEGMGAYINGRLRIENSYLTILWKTGLLALVFWLVPFALALKYFRQVKRSSPHYRLACAFFWSLVLVYVQTAYNPYLNNPIGLSLVLVALFSLKTLAASNATRALLVAGTSEATS